MMHVPEDKQRKGRGEGGHDARNEKEPSGQFQGPVSRASWGSIWNAVEVGCWLISSTYKER